MKINIVLLIISVVIAGLSAFGIFALNAESDFRILITIGCGLSLFVTLGGLLALSSERPGMANIRALSGVFFAVLLIAHIVFSFTGVSITLYIIFTGIVLALYVLLCYLIRRVIK